MIVTQSTPGLDDIYGENARLSLEAACGTKLYITPQDRKTAKELSGALGTRTRKAKSYSRSASVDVMQGSSVSVREEGQPLLSEQDTRKFDPDKVIIVPAGQHPIQADRIRYFEDRALKPLFESQKGALPWPALRSDTDAKVVELDRKVRDQDAALRAAVAASDPSKAANHEAGTRLQEALAWTAKAEERLASMGEKADEMEALLTRSEQRIAYLEKLPVTPDQVAKDAEKRSEMVAVDTVRDRALGETEASEVADLMSRIDRLGLSPGDGG